MKKYILSIILLVSIAANEIISIEGFDFAENTFSFSGKTNIDDGLKLKINLVLNKQIGATCFIVSKYHYWEGSFVFPEKIIIPGEYLLQITIPYQRTKKHQDIWNDYKNVVFEKELFVQPKEQLRVWQKLKEQLIENVQSQRFFFDKMILKGHMILWDLQETKEEQKKQELRDDWLTTKRTLPDYKAQQKVLRRTYIENIAINPYASTVVKIELLYSLLQQLQNHIHEKIIDIPQQEMLPFFVLVQNIKYRVNSIFVELESQNLWQYKIEISSETGRFKEQNYYSYHGFQFSVRGTPVKIIPGEENSPLRLTLQYQDFDIQVFRIDSPDTNIKRKQNIWNLLASYEWDLVEKTGEYVELKKPNSDKNRKIYSIQYSSRNKNKITGVLFFSSDFFYCILSKYAENNTFALESITKITKTFDF